jgi:hypothetical protein
MSTFGHSMGTMESDLWFEKLLENNKSVYLFQFETVSQLLVTVTKHPR